jgi:predicted transglutaminase-like cysteine proteinase
VLTIGRLGAALAVAVVATMAWPTAKAEAESSRSMVVGQMTSQPIGHYDFCKRHSSECIVRTGRGAAPNVTDYGWNVVREVNVSVNASILPRTDEEMHGIEELWSYPDLEGDCEDYVLLKRLMLMERGFAASDLLITVVRKADGEGHAVLTLRTSEGDYILDNLDDDVRLWSETPYVFLKRQASFHSGRWVSIENTTDVLVGALD